MINYTSAYQVGKRVASGSRREKKGLVSLSIIVFYTLLVFVFMPSLVSRSDASIYGAAAGILYRFPLVVGAIMVAVSLVTKRPVGKIKIPIVLFLAFGFFFTMSGFQGPLGPAESIRLLFAHVGIGLCLVLTLRTTKQLDYFLGGMVLVAMINAVYGLLFTVPGMTYLGEALRSLGFPSGRDLNEWRLIGLLKDPTNCGLLLMIGFLVALDGAIRKAGPVHLACFLVLFTAIFLTFSRTTWVATVIGVFVLIAEKKIALNRYLVILAFGGLFLIVTHQLFSYSVSQNLFRWNIARSDTRSGVWLFWLGMALKDPTGSGIGFVQQYCQKNMWQAPHNIYLSLFVEGGFQTLIPLVLLLWYCWRAQWRVRKYVDPETGRSYGPLLLSVFAATAASLFALSFMMQLLFIASGLCLAGRLMAYNGRLVAKDKPVNRPSL